MSLQVSFWHPFNITLILPSAQLSFQVALAHWCLEACSNPQVLSQSKEEPRKIPVELKTGLVSLLRNSKIQNLATELMAPQKKCREEFASISLTLEVIKGSPRNINYFALSSLTQCLVFITFLCGSVGSHHEICSSAYHPATQRNSGMSNVMDSFHFGFRIQIPRVSTIMVRYYL